MRMGVSKHTNKQKRSGSSLCDNPESSVLNTVPTRGYGRPNWQEENRKCEFLWEATKAVVLEITHTAHVLDFQRELGELKS